MWKSFRLVGAVAALLGLGGCASLPGPASASKCGDPCATMSCPGAFHCEVDGQCAARCVPESLGPGKV